MQKIIALAGSNSRTSINKQLIDHTAARISDASVDTYDLNDFPMPIFGVDYEEEHGHPAQAIRFFALLQEADGIIISLAEHNGSYSAAFKNLFDWISRMAKDCWLYKPMLLMATSPGGRGGASVLAAASDRFPRQGGNIVATYSLPSFDDTFRNGRIVDVALDQQLDQRIRAFIAAIR